MAGLGHYLNLTVNIITHDGRVLIGKLEGFDRNVNAVLKDCHERIFSADDGVEVIRHGLYIVRGDNIALIGEVDVALDATIDYSQIKADPINAIVY